MVYDYYASGAEDEWTLAENRNAFSRILFRPQILIDVSNIDMRTTVLGFKILMPIMIAPTAMQKMAHPEGSEPNLALLEHKSIHLYRMVRKMWSMLKHLRLILLCWMVFLNFFLGVGFYRRSGHPSLKVYLSYFVP